KMTQEQRDAYTIARVMEEERVAYEVADIFAEAGIVPSCSASTARKRPTAWKRIRTDSSTDLGTGVSGMPVVVKSSSGQTFGDAMADYAQARVDHTGTLELY
ncbi:MAG: hypothetical protein V1659_03640, partial [Candidatus Woesearchaeota archaeon]